MLNCMALWQSVEVYRVTLGRDPRSRQMHPSHRAFTQYLVQYGFTSGSRTTSNVGYLNTATEPMIVLRWPIRVALCLRFAIWLSVCDGRRPWLLNFDRSAIKGCVEADAIKQKIGYGIRPMNRLLPAKVPMVLTP